MPERARIWLAAPWLVLSLAWACGGTESNPKPGSNQPEIAGAGGDAGAGAREPVGGVTTGGSPPTIGRWDESHWDDPNVVWGD